MSSGTQLPSNGVAHVFPQHHPCYASHERLGREAAKAIIEGGMTAVVSDPRAPVFARVAIAAFSDSVKTFPGCSVTYLRELSVGLEEKRK